MKLPLIKRLPVSVFIVIGCLALLLMSMSAINHIASAQSSVRPPSNASLPAASDKSSPAQRTRAPSNSGTARNPFAVPDPTAGKGAIYDTKMWRQLRHGVSGKVSILDGKAGQLIQSDGWEWMKLRNGKLQRYGGWALGATLAFLAVFFLFKGRIRIKSGWSGRTITRFGFMERMAHWMLAGSFIILAISGLNMLYGKSLLLPVLGKPAFAYLTTLGKLAHNYVAFAFMAGILMTFIMWVWHNLPTWRDIIWIVKLGGFLGHASAGKFNAGQKILFWLIMASGVSISVSGLALMFPFQVPLFGETFSTFNRFGLELPTALSPIQEMQYSSTWHAILGLAMTCIIIAHIYIGTLGMQGAFSAMGSGEVDENWAREHHDVWADQVSASKGEGAHDDVGAPTGAQPAE